METAQKIHTSCSDTFSAWAVEELVNEGRTARSGYFFGGPRPLPGGVIVEEFSGASSLKAVQPELGLLHFIAIHEHCGIFRHVAHLICHDWPRGPACAHWPLFQSFSRRYN